MLIFDSHCHLDDKSYAKDLPQVIRNAHHANVQAMMVVGIDIATSQKAISIANAYDNVFASVGIHPHDAKQCDASVLATLQSLADHPKVRAWGETGLDFNRMYSPREDQERCFNRQLEIGAALGLPMIFHERDSQGRFLEILRHHWTAQRTGVVHCFSGNETELDAYLELGLCIGVTGIVTIASRGNNLRKMVQRIPDDRLLVETDAPYLTPTPERNKFRRNEPAFVRTVLSKLAELKKQSLETMAAITWANTCRLFQITDVKK